MVKPEWGTKRTCPKCATRFYDLGKDDPVTCIACGINWHPEPVLKSKQPMPLALEHRADRQRLDPPVRYLAEEPLEHRVVEHLPLLQQLRLAGLPGRSCWRRGRCS